VVMIVNRVTPSRLRPNHYRHYRQRYVLGIPDMPDLPRFPPWKPEVAAPREYPRLEFSHFREPPTG